TRRALFEGGTHAAGAIAAAAIVLPPLGFALGPLFEDGVDDDWQDVGEEADFDATTYVSAVITLVNDTGEVGKTTIYVRKTAAEDKEPKGQDPQPYVAISTRCMHLGCPIRYVEASERFICPCHGGVYNFQGEVDGGPPVRPLDRFYTRVVEGRVQVGKRFSLNSELKRFSPRDPAEHLDGLWQYLYPSRPSTG
ncbi:MAG: Rieske 2Fe-2S domain-containing protein, partial [Thermoleophilaceae bacterium]|nr:Rieske 2Fe-2S domain-containing protein [Thermoleophilaceae bacterium]